MSAGNRSSVDSPRICRAEGCTRTGRFTITGVGGTDDWCPEHLGPVIVSADRYTTQGGRWEVRLSGTTDE